MSSQPLNSDILVYRNVRSYRQGLRHESVKAMTGKLRQLVLQVPGQEIQTQVNKRDVNVADFSSFMTAQAWASPTGGAVRGMPIVIGTRGTRDLNAVNVLTAGTINVFEIGTDKFVEKKVESTTTNLFSDVQGTALDTGSAAVN